MTTKEEKQICLGTWSKEKLEEMITTTHEEEEAEGKEKSTIVFASTDCLTDDFSPEDLSGENEKAGIVSEHELDERLPNIPVFGLASQQTPDELREQGYIPSQELMDYWN